MGNPEELFLNPGDMLEALAARDKGATVFQGELFDALRVLAKAADYPKLQDAIVNLLRAFDSQVNRENSLDAIFRQAANFASMLREDDAQRVLDVLNRLAPLMERPESDGDARRALGGFIKSELLPLLTEMAGKYRFVNGDKFQNQLMSIIHQVVRFDKSDIRLLQDAMTRLGDELKSFGKLNDEDIADMRRLLFAHLRAAKAQVGGPYESAWRAAASGKGAQAAQTGQPAQTGQSGQAAAQQTGQSGQAAAQQAGQSGQAAAQQTGQPGQAAAQQTGQPQQTAAQQTGQPQQAAAQQAGQPQQTAAQQAAQPLQTGEPQTAEQQQAAAKDPAPEALPGRAGTPEALEQRGAAPETERAARGANAEKAGGADGKADDEAAKAPEARAAKDISEVLAKALESGASARINAAAQNLLAQLIQSESPVFALLHFLLPVKYHGDEVYSEFYIDKDCDERKGEGEGSAAQNIFFIIQSEKFGNFEVDLLVRERVAELGIKCPDHLKEDVKAIRSDLRAMMEELGYRLAAYNVDAYREDRSVLQRFPKLAMRKAGIDVRI
jgi:hypothetical protein